MNQSYLKVEDFILQRDRMKLIDEIISVDELSSVSESVVSPAWPLCENGYVHPIIIIELVAQTAGINIKWNDTGTGERSAKDDNGGGVLVGIKKAVFHVNRIDVYSIVRTCSIKKYSQMSYAEFSGSVTMGEQVLGEVLLQLFRTD
jgi:predicted hotdog family 3-hydroxylacyl-ACP dehydratase